MNTNGEENPTSQKGRRKSKSSKRLLQRREVKMVSISTATTRYAIPKFPLLFTSSPSSSFLRSFPNYALFLSLSFHSHHPPNPNDIHQDVASFNRLLHLRPPPSIIQINKLLGSLAKMRHYPTVISLWTRAKSRGFTPCIVTLNILVNCYCHMGQMAFAFSILGKIFKNGLFDEAINLLSKMKENGCFPDSITYEILIRALLEKGENDTAKKLLHEMVASGLLKR
ncbi:putative pentatricopeptide repeat-containing protein [Senna tora]|uniref:Putative pentatricopeptide repeat-containing protein n=1 Tax=Senna tora TaxID=362788 RepID=A0A834XBI6_9FABA|nr:putative pentatricopeptide repeat-containing protein [Senna tora]